MAARQAAPRDRPAVHWRQPLLRRHSSSWGCLPSGLPRLGVPLAITSEGRPASLAARWRAVARYGDVIRRVFIWWSNFDRIAVDEQSAPCTRGFDGNAEAREHQFSNFGNEQERSRKVGQETWYNEQEPSNDPCQTRTGLPRGNDAAGHRFADAPDGP